MPAGNMTPPSRRVTRHLVSINDLSNTEIESVSEAAQAYLNERGDRQLNY
jgi:hypothetical protein